MQRTISVMVGKGSVNHNSRKFHAINTDPERSCLNRSYCNEDIREVYHELFDEAVKLYNEKQTRSDRIVGNYYEKIRSGKQEKTFHEIILQIGNRDDMSAKSPDGKLAANVLDEYMQTFRERNPNLRVFSAHLHMDEATPHLHIDFVPFTNGSKRGIDTRVSLKQALAAQGFKGSGRQETEWNKWVASEKKQLSDVMQRYGIEWEQKGTHEKHLSVYEYEKKMRAKEVEKLSEEITVRRDELETLSQRIENYESGKKAVSEIAKMLDTSPEYQLAEPQGLMSAKNYKSKLVEPLVKKLKALIKNVLLRYFKVKDDYVRLNQFNGRLYRENETLHSDNSKLSSENKQLKEKIKDYSLLRKMFGNQQVNKLLEQAKDIKQSKRRDTRFRNTEIER
ncbi:plasmid recombination protein [Clostridia bacterium OttesenSCG-928-F22]|nr:plasmid recombination protein [Clostridia bacterium OttesenSCG-928-F22]